MQVNTLPDNIDILKRFILERVATFQHLHHQLVIEQQESLSLSLLIEKLKLQIARLKRTQFGRLRRSGFGWSNNDVLTPTDVAINAFESAREPKRLVILPGGHFDAYVNGFTQSSGNAISWFKQWLIE